MKIGKTLRIYRNRNNFTQFELAYSAEINEKYYGQIERDECSPTIEKLEMICNVLGIRMSDFLELMKVMTVRFFIKPYADLESIPHFT